MPIRRIAGLALVVAVCAACRPPAPPRPEPDAAALRAAIEQRLQAILQALERRDAAAATAAFTADAVWVLPDGSALTGTAAIAAGYERFFAPLASFEVESVTIDRFLVVDDRRIVTFAHAVGTLKMTHAPAPERNVNYFADEWQLDPDGTWRIAYEINADGPLMAPAPPNGPPR